MPARTDPDVVRGGLNEMSWALLDATLHAVPRRVLARAAALSDPHQQVMGADHRRVLEAIRDSAGPHRRELSRPAGTAHRPVGRGAGGCSYRVPWAGGARRVRPEHLDVEASLEAPAQRLVELGQRGPAGVLAERLRAGPLLDHDQPVISLVQGVQQAAVVVGVHVGDGLLHGRDDLGAVLRQRADGGDDDNLGHDG